MTDVREATDDLLAEKPDLEADLRDVLAVDADADGWTFDDVPVDSGTFGELVSRGVVVSDGDDYEVADPDAVRAALDGEDDPETDDGAFGADGLTLPSASDLSLPSVSRTEAGALAVALAFVVLMRTYVFPSVFRAEYVVLPGNDPYLYRYWVEQLAAESAGSFDFSTLSTLSEQMATGEPLLVGTLWWATSFLGGAEASGLVLAFYPVVSAVVVAALVYVLAKQLTGDARVGVAAVLLLAVVPAFAYRTSLGFADHHAFDYPWLALTAVSLAAVSRTDIGDLSTPRPWLAAGALGVAVSAQVMAWEAGPLLVGALGVYVAVRAVADVRADRSPLVPVVPILAGLAVASVLSHLAHAGFGWQSDVVAYSPVLLFVGVLTVGLVGEAFRRTGLPAFVFGTAEVAGALGGLALVFTVLPSFAEVLSNRVDFLLNTSRAAETQSIFAGGPSGLLLGPILELGLVWLLGLPVLVLATRRAYRRDDAAWLVVVAYGWYFLALATIQRRFVGELAPFVALAAGWGFVAFVARLDVVEPPAFAREDSKSPTRSGSALQLPDRSTVTALAFVFLLVASAGIVQTAVRNEQVKIDDQRFQAAAWMDGHAADRALEYPDDYVFSQWGRNRMYNYFVNGESASYWFAQQNYEAFLSGTDAATWYDRLGNQPTGFVVTKNVDTQGPVSPQTNYATLHQRYGSSGPNDADGAGHFRAVYASDDESVKVFTVVPGATIVGEASPGETVTVSKQVDVGGRTVTYEREATANPYGVFGVTVPYAGEYSVDGAAELVSDDAASSGEMVRRHDRDGVAHWPFDHVENGTAHDRVGGHPATVSDSVSNVSGVDGRAVEFDGETGSVAANVSAPDEFTLDLWVNPDRLETPGEYDYQRLVSGKNQNLLTLQGDGQVTLRLPSLDEGYHAAGNVSVDEWSHVVATYDGTNRTIYVDGERAGTNRTAEGTVDWNGKLSLGSRFGGGSQYAFDGTMDEVRIYDRALTPDEVRERYESTNQSRE